MDEWTPNPASEICMEKKQIVLALFLSYMVGQTSKVLQIVSEIVFFGFFFVSISNFLIYLQMISWLMNWKSTVTRTCRCRRLTTWGVLPHAIVKLCIFLPLSWRTKRKVRRGIFYFFSCDQAAIWLVQSVRPSVRLSVCLSVRHTFFTMFPSSYHHEIFRSYYHGQKWCPCKRSRSQVKGQGHRGQHPT